MDAQLHAKIIHGIVFMLWNGRLGSQPRVPPVAAGGETSKRGPGGSKAPEKPSASPLSSALRHGLRWPFQVLTNCVRPTPDSLFGDVPDLYITKASEIETDRENWKRLRPTKRC